MESATQKAQQNWKVAKEHNSCSTDVKFKTFKCRRHPPPPPKKAIKSAFLNLLIDFQKLNQMVMPCLFINEKLYTLKHFFVNNIYFFFTHTTQHNIQNTTKQNNRHILNISRSNQKGGREGRTTRTQKSLLYTITYIQQKTLPSINGRRPGPTDSRRCTFT